MALSVGSTAQMMDSTPLLDLNGQITLVGNYESGHGGFANVWAGIWRSDSGTFKVLHEIVSCMEWLLQLLRFRLLSRFFGLRPIAKTMSKKCIR